MSRIYIFAKIARLQINTEYRTSDLYD